MIKISPSILGYEPNLKRYLININRSTVWPKILEITSLVDSLHIDVMRPPFIPRTTRFSSGLLEKLYQRLKRQVKFDFHLMVYHPLPLVKILKKIIPKKERKNITITISREIYRENLGKYKSKKYDLLKIKTRNSVLEKRIFEANKTSHKKVLGVLEEIRKAGFKTGLAIEPNTSLENVPREMLKKLDAILLMGVYSGKGGQKFNQKILAKIQKQRQKNSQLMIGVDGGIKNSNLPAIIKAGANNLIIGSFITKNKSPRRIIKKIQNEITSSYSNFKNCCEENWR